MSTNKPNKRPALGKGLEALLSNSSTDITSTKQMEDNVNTISIIKIEDITANPFNPRTQFEKEALQELASSIMEHGIIQPLTVRKMGRGKYQLISGERRFRASQLAGLTEVPAYIRVASDQTMLEMALVENIQREDLNAIEVALSYQHLMDECNLTQEQLSQKVSKSRAAIANFLRLLKLPAEIQLGVINNKISMGHARALVSAGNEEEQKQIYQQILDEELSVREVEGLVKVQNKGAVQGKKEKAKRKSALSAFENKFESDFSSKLASKVAIQKTDKGSGKIVIKFNSENDLNRIIELLKK